MTILLAYCIISQDNYMEDCLHLNAQILNLIKSFRYINPFSYAYIYIYKKENVVKRDEGLGDRNLTEERMFQKKKCMG